MPAESETAEKKIEWLKSQLWRIDAARRQLVSAKKQRVSEYDERLRKLRDFSDALYVKSTDEQQLDLFVEDELLTPALDRLLNNPLQGL
jgi:hypothetical protein